MMSISTTLFGKISHASLFITGQLRNPWQMLAEPWGSAEPRLKNTVVRCFATCFIFRDNLSQSAAELGEERNSSKVYLSKCYYY